MDRYEILKLSAETGLLLSSILLFFQSDSSLKKDSKVLQFFQTAYEFSPKTLIEILEENLPDVIKANFLKFEQDESLAKFTGFIKGKVFTPNPLNGYLDRTKRLIASKLTVEPIFSNTSAIDIKDMFIKRSSVSEALLHDVGHSNSVLLKNVANTDKEFALIKIGSKSEYKESGLLSLIFPNIIRVFQFFFSLIRLYPQVKGIRLGHRIIEYGIPMQQVVVALGRMTYDKRNKIVTMDKPQFFLQDKSQLIAAYKSRVIRWSRLKTFSLLLMGIFAFLSIRRVVALADKIKQYVQNTKEKFQMEKLRSIGNLLPDELKCIICIENPKNVIFKPCLHMAICKTCCQKLEKRVCPICKKVIKDTVNIFIA